MLPTSISWGQKILIFSGPVPGNIIQSEKEDLDLIQNSVWLSHTWQQILYSQFTAASHDGFYLLDFTKPSCTCGDFLRHNLPCKHFFAVFLCQPEWGWNRLPSQYLSSPELTLDITVKGSQAEHGSSGSGTSTSVDESCQMVDTDNHESNGIMHSFEAELPRRQVRM